MDIVMKVPEYFKGLRETKMSGLASTLRPPQEFFDHQRLSRPADMNEVTSRVSYNTRYFSGNYAIIIALLAVYALLTNPLLLIALGLLIGGFAAINRFAPDPAGVEVGGQVVTQKSLYITLFVIGIPLLWWSAPLSTFFWLVGSSIFIILFHASFIEPGIESEYATAESQV